MRTRAEPGWPALWVNPAPLTPKPRCCRSNDGDTGVYAFKIVCVPDVVGLGFQHDLEGFFRHMLHGLQIQTQLGERLHALLQLDGFGEKRL